MSNDDYILKTVNSLKSANKKIPIEIQIKINFEQIKANLNMGMKISQIYQALIIEKKINCSSRGFYNALKKLPDTKIEFSLKENITSKEKEETTNNDNQNKKLSFDQIRKERQLKVASLNQPQMKQRTIEDVENNINDLL
ncbi:MAG: hypothetical protein UHD07_01010 [Ruminobacter sp.]|nr:hypothetical protein [Ruminobacter sp.]